MPKYFFHIRTPDTFLEDDVGMNLPDLAQAKQEAEQGARDIMAQDLKAGRAVDHQQFDICDESGDVVLVVRFRDMLRSPSP